MSNDPFGFPEETPIDTLRRAAEKVLMAQDPKTGDAKAERSRKAKATRAMGKDLEKRTIAYYQSRGYMAFSVGFNTMDKFGRGHQRDLLGVADCMAILGNNLVHSVTLVQSTTDEPAQINAHLRKYVDPKNIEVRTGKSAYQNLLDWFDQGGEFEMCLWSKPNGRNWGCRIQAYSKDFFTERFEKKHGGNQ